MLQGLLFTAREPEFQHLVSKRNYDIGKAILNSSAQGRKKLKQLDSKFSRLVLKTMEKLLLPNIGAHYVLRKAYIESNVRKAIEQGATQIINLGAGFDTLLYRLAEENSNLNCIEIDHPATHKIKKAALCTQSMKLNNLHFLPVDFTHQSLEEELASAAFFSQQQPTVCILEGVLMYLTPRQIYSLFASLNTLLLPPIHLVFTAVEPPAKHPESYGPLLKLYLRLKGEPLNWLCQEQHLQTFMDASAFALQETANSDQFRERFIPDYTKSLHKGEYGAVAIATEK